MNSWSKSRSRLHALITTYSLADLRCLTTIYPRLQKAIKLKYFLWQLFHVEKDLDSQHAALKETEEVRVCEIRCVTTAPLT